MVDLHLLFDGAPLITPIMVVSVGVSVYLVARAIDQLLNTAESIAFRRRVSDAVVEVKQQKKAPRKSPVKKVIWDGGNKKAVKKAVKR
jgi:hypothetical protein